MFGLLKKLLRNNALLCNMTIIMIVVAFCMSFIIGSTYKRTICPVDNPVEKIEEIEKIETTKPTETNEISKTNCFNCSNCLNCSNCPVEPWIDQMEILKKYLVKGNPNYKEDDDDN